MRVRAGEGRGEESATDRMLHQAANPASVQYVGDGLQARDALLQIGGELLGVLHRGAGLRRFLSARARPVAHHGRRHLDVALKAQTLAEDERLIRAIAALQDVTGARREAEGLAVPVERVETRFQTVQPVARRRPVDAIDRQPADLLDRITRHRAAERLTEQLTAQAMPQYWPVGCNRLTDQAQHLGNPRQIVVYAHWTAHEHQTGRILYTLGDGFVFVDLDETIGQAVAGEEVGEVSRPFAGGVSEDPNGFHVVILALPDVTVNIKPTQCVLSFFAAVSLTTAVPVLAADDGIVLYALFKDKAILTIDGARRVLKAGETSPEGVKLISTDTEQEQAVVEAGGRRETLKLGVVVSRFEGSSPAAVTLWADGNGFFFANGSINGSSVTFLVDTGANSVALSGVLAERLGIDYKKKGLKGIATTASGHVRNYVMKLDTVKIGEIVLHNVDAAVLEGSHPSTPLLGMSVLNSLEMRRDGNKMDLIKKY